MRLMEVPMIEVHMRPQERGRCLFGGPWRQVLRVLAVRQKRHRAPMPCGCMPYDTNFTTFTTSFTRAAVHYENMINAQLES